MDQPEPEPPAAGSKPPKKPAGSELLSGLDSLLKQESAGLELPADDALGADDLTALFAEGETAPKAPAPPSPAARAAARGRPGSRSARLDRRNQDQEVYRNLESYMQTTPLGLQVAEDRMTVRISRITGQNTAEEIFGLLRDENITGIDFEAIREAVTKASLGQAQYGVVVARGRPARVLRPAEIVHHLPPETVSRKPNPFELFKKALESPNQDALKAFTVPLRMVRKGDMVAEVRPAEAEQGCDVYGQPVETESANAPQLAAGDNTALSEDGGRCSATIYGYAGLLDGRPAVLPPIWVSPDLMQVFFICLPNATPAVPSRPELQELAELRWVEYGLQETQLDLIQKRLEQRQPLPLATLIAQGTAALNGENAQVRFSFDPFETLKWAQFQTLLTSKSREVLQDSLRELFGEAGQSGVRVKAVRPGEVVGEKVPATPGTPGRDIHGEEVAAQEGADAELQAGDGLAFAEDNLRCAAQHFGLVCLHRENQVHLVRPLWVAPDASAVYYLNLPQNLPPRHPSLEEMSDLLGAAKIQHGFTAERWVETLADLQAGRLREYLVPVAQATPAQPGKDAAFEWAIRIGEAKPGKVQEDGTIDYRDRNLYVAVKEKDLLGRLVHPQPGVPGTDVYGREVRAPQPLNIEVVTDSRIYAEPAEDGAMLFYAETGGGISTKTQVKEAKSGTHQRISIGVYAISNIEHDVDYNTGNVDFNGDVVIGGSVLPQFSVRATGSVTIGGYVEAGAYITAGGDILVKRGVVGSNTELVAGGSVLSKFIQEATVRAGGDVKAGSYIFNASIRCGGQVMVVGKGEGKSRALVGGLIWAAQGIAARSIGSPYNAGTRLVVGVDPEQVTRSEQLRANLSACQEKKMALLQSIGLTVLDLELIKQRLAQSPSAKYKQTILMTVRRIAKMAELEQNLQQELEDIGEAQRELSRKATIQVSNEVFAGVELRIGEQLLLLQEDRQKVSFKLVLEEDRERILMGGPGAPPRE